MRLEHPIADKIQQGAIFNCIAVPGYENCRCWGIVLTARCDLEHNKQSVINYLPIVSFRDCLLRHLSFHVAKRMRKELEKELANTLAAKGVSEQIRTTFQLADIIDLETRGKERVTLLEKLQQLTVAKQILHAGGTYNTEAAKALIATLGKKTDALVEDLIEQKLGEYYFLESVDYCVLPEEGFVVLLRHMRTIDTDIMERIVVGLTPASAQVIPRCDQHLTFEHETLCMVIGVLRSPDLEHLAQQFAHLFVRIGLEDHKQSTIDNHTRITKAQ